MRNSTLIITIMVIIVLLLTIVVIEQRLVTRHPLSAYIGRECSVQFKRNALGAGATLPVPPTTHSINGAEVSIRGTLRKVRRDGILVRVNQNMDYWIPMDSVLLVSTF